MERTLDLLSREVNGFVRPSEDIPPLYEPTELQAFFLISDMTIRDAIRFGVVMRFPAVYRGGSMWA
jgi:hypothetical protein